MHLAEFNACVRAHNEANGGAETPAMSDSEHDDLIERYG